MLKDYQLKKAKKLLNLKNNESVEALGTRMRGWIKNVEEKEDGEITEDAILRGLNLILSDLQLKEIQQAKNIKKINLENVKNPIIKKFANKILELEQQGISIRKITEFINKESNKKISYGTIYKFLTDQKKEKKEEENE